MGNSLDQGTHTNLVKLEGSEGNAETLEELLDLDAVPIVVLFLHQLSNIKKRSYVRAVRLREDHNGILGNVILGLFHFA
jgi:hypothetical protein